MSNRGVWAGGCVMQAAHCHTLKYLKPFLPSQPLCVSHLMPGGQKQQNLHREVALSIKDLLLALNHWYSQAAKACCYIRSLLFNELCLPALFSSRQAPRRPVLCHKNSFHCFRHICGVKLTGCGSFVGEEMNQSEGREKCDNDSCCIW